LPTAKQLGLHLNSRKASTGEETELYAQHKKFYTHRRKTQSQSRSLGATPVAIFNSTIAHYSRIFLFASLGRWF
jgi:hypothetical protein